MRAFIFILVSFISCQVFAGNTIHVKDQAMLDDPCADLSILTLIEDGQERWNTLQQHLRENDWPYLCRYRRENAKRDISQEPDIVFMGDSITEMWVGAMPAMFGDKWVGRGIGGQTSSQMVVRFYQDVVSLKPRQVHLMVGTNDLAGNSGANSFDQYQNNLRAMVDLAQANGIDVIIASILPADHFSWRPSVNPAQQIKRINHWLQELADEKGLIYIDYYSAMANGEGGMPQALAADGVHPTLEGYTIMRNTLERALTKTH